MDSDNDSRAVLAVVIIARNEEKYIGRCISSVLKATQRLQDCEVLLVDSRSADCTVEIAHSFHIRVAELRESAPLSPALSRRVGQHLTKSRYILFVDGDTEIERDWVKAALEVFERDQRVAGVGGKLRELYFKHGVLVGENPDCFETGNFAEEAYQLGGNAIYRRDALNMVGSFNPQLVSYEEAELAERLRKAGFVVVRLPILLGTHRTGLAGSYPELKRRRRDNLMHGHGQVLRLSIRDGLFTRHARQLKRYLQFITLLLIGIIALLTSALTLDPTYAAAWVGMCVLLTITFIMRSRSLTKPFRLIMEWSFSAIPLLAGFLRPLPDASCLEISNVIGSATFGHPDRSGSITTCGAK